MPQALISNALAAWPRFLKTWSMPETRPSLIVFTDLDGTLLDHETYDWRAALPALTRLKAMNAAVVLASSKTGPEIARLQNEMGLTQWPAIVENGAGLLGDGAPPQYTALRASLDQIDPSLRQGFTGFGDMSPDEVAQCTGLAREDAERAKARAFSEPGLWSGADHARERFISSLAALGITAREGGRFLTLSFGTTKADQMAKVITRLSPRHTIALGDAPNDIEMLEAADFGVIVANPHRTPLPPLHGEVGGRICRSELAGPLGWNTTVLQLLDRIDLSQEEE